MVGGAGGEGGDGGARQVRGLEDESKPSDLSPVLLVLRGRGIFQIFHHFV